MRAVLLVKPERQKASAVNQRADPRPIREWRKGQRRFERLSRFQAYSPALRNLPSSPKDQRRGWRRFTVIQFKLAALLIEQVNASFFIDRPSSGAHAVNGQIKVHPTG